MKLMNLTGLATVLALSACASHNASAPPSAMGRAPVNSPDQIAAFQASTPAAPSLAADTRLERQVNDLSRQVGELKAYLVMLQTAQEQKLLPAQAEVTPKTAARTVAAASSPALTMTIGHGAGDSRFSLGAEEAQSFVAAAKASAHVTIRGRSDGNQFSPQAKALAIDRAVRIKAFLVGQGVAPEKIRIMYCTHGCQVADGSTSEGQDLNRQSRIEFRAPTALAGFAMAAKG
ncbi:OmpA family protein (plasmid) [Asticcacaulis sp. DW145]|uniref:OmpA family protein n=1 Tax=Asticcacaulis sp. DW145 TaxID=3095608 RepID=UPI00308898B0|nr:OmpA family protein [Asticcacaulis sp. DW145]